jgi:hypothetical protein
MCSLSMFTGLAGRDEFPLIRLDQAAFRSPEELNRPVA